MEYKYNNFYEIIEKNAKKYKNKPAYFIDNKKVTWNEFKKLIDTFSRALHIMGIKTGDKIPILVTNSLEFIIAMQGIQKIGAVAVPVNTFLKEEEIAFILNDIKADILIASKKLQNNIKNIRNKTDVKKIIWEGDIKKTDENNLSFNELILDFDSHEVIKAPKLEDLVYIRNNRKS